MIYNGLLRGLASLVVGVCRDVCIAILGERHCHAFFCAVKGCDIDIVFTDICLMMIVDYEL